MPERTHGGVYPDIERVDMVITQMPILGYGAYYVEAVQAARDALATQSTKPVCTCPSGDGSLRWPCLVHPPTQPTGEEQR